MSKKNIEKIYEKLGCKTFEPSVLLKVAIILGFIIAVLESILFLPFAWTIWWFNRHTKLLYGIDESSRKSMAIVSLIFLLIIPGILMLIDNAIVKNKNKSQSNEEI